MASNEVYNSIDDRRSLLKLCMQLTIYRGCLPFTPENQDISDGMRMERLINNNNNNLYFVPKKYNKNK